MIQQVSVPVGALRAPRMVKARRTILLKILDRMDLLVGPRVQMVLFGRKIEQDMEVPNGSVGQMKKVGKKTEDESPFALTVRLDSKLVDATLREVFSIIDVISKMRTVEGCEPQDRAHAIEDMLSSFFQVHEALNEYQINQEKGCHYGFQHRLMLWSTYTEMKRTQTAKLDELDREKIKDKFKKDLVLIVNENREYMDRLKIFFLL